MFKYMHYNKSLFFIGLLFIVSGCSKIKQYHNNAITPLNPQINFKIKKDNIDLRAKKFTPVDCYQLFGERGKKLITHNHRTSIYPIQLSITNHSNNTYVLDKKHIGLRLLPYQNVAHRMQYSSVLRSVGLLFSGAAVAALVALGGLTALAIGVATTFAPIVIIGAGACITAPFMLVVGTPVSSTINGIQSLRTNSTIKKDIKNKTFTHQIIIKPNQSIDTIIFVKGRNYKNEFSLNLYEKNNKDNTITIDVELKKHQP